MMYGNPALRVVTDTTDRIGIRVLVLSLLWQPTTAVVFEALVEGPEVPTGMPGGLALVGKQTLPAAGALRTFWTFEGIDGDGKSVTFKDRSNSPDFVFEPGFEQKDIGAHPDLQKFLDDYGGDTLDGQIIFQPTISAPSGGPALGLGSGSGVTAKKKNPLYGEKTFMRLTGTYSFRYCARNLGGIEKGVGKIHKGGLPGQAPTYEDQDWLKAPSPYAHRGTIFEITELYLLSGPGGWPEPLYGKGSRNPGG